MHHDVISSSPGMGQGHNHCMQPNCCGNTYAPCHLRSVVLGSQVFDEFSGQSYRLLALAKGVLRGVDKQAMSLMTQEQLEAHAQGFELLGLLVLSNSLRPDSKATVTELQQRSVSVPSLSHEQLGSCSLQQHLVSRELQQPFANQSVLGRLKRPTPQAVHASSPRPNKHDANRF